MVFDAHAPDSTEQHPEILVLRQLYGSSEQHNVLCYRHWITLAQWRSVEVYLRGMRKRRTRAPSTVLTMLQHLRHHQ